MARGGGGLRGKPGGGSRGGGGSTPRGKAIKSASGSRSNKYSNGHAKQRKEQDDELGLSDSEDGLDAFQKRNDKVSLNMSDDDNDDDKMDQDEAVFDLSDDEDEDDAQLDSEDLIEDAIAHGGRAAVLGKQAKLGRRDAKLQQKEDDSEQSEGNAAADKSADVGGRDHDERLWGANKRAYYDADTADHEVMDDADTMKEELEEALRIQKASAAKLRASDYGLEDEEEGDEALDEEPPEEAATMGSKAKKAQAVVTSAGPSSGKRAPQAVEVEAIAKDLGGLTSEARLAAVMADAPELLALLQDLQESLAEVRHRVGPLLEEVRNGDLATEQGISYLEAKHLLLLSYVINIVFYLLLKAEGKPVRDHPVIGRLLELRAYLEKVKPIDKQLHYQIEKLIKAAEHARSADAVRGNSDVADEERMASGASAGVRADDNEADQLRYGPKPDQLVTKLDLSGAVGPDGQVGVYKPPKLNPVAMDTGEDGLSKKDKRQLDHAKRRSARSELVRELAAELAGAPEESRYELPGQDSMAAIRQRQRLEARASEEEDLMLRVPLSKDEAKRQRVQRRQALAGGGLADDFADEVADIVDASKSIEGGKAGGLADLFSRQKVSQKFGGELVKPIGQSGDEDLPRKKELYERRAMFDNIAAKRAALAAAGGGDDDDESPDGYDIGAGGKKGGKRARGGEEDDFYTAAKAAAEARRLARQDAHTAPALHAPLADERAEGQRGITYEIEKNRGLTPHRRKDLKNPRKKNRLRFEGAVVRRKGQVQGVREQATPYGGETTGIKSRVVKSKKFSG